LQQVPLTLLACCLLLCCAVSHVTARYLLCNQLNLTSNQVLRGAGRDATSLFFSTSLQQLHGWGPHWKAGMEKSPYTWAGGLISTQREKRLFNPRSLYLANVTRPAARGDTRLYLGFYRDNNKRADQLIVPGQWMSLTMIETPKVSTWCYVLFLNM
jgi:hypothetical protein